jgi:isoquinoline 1-oxidoreductase beta subunit
VIVHRLLKQAGIGILESLGTERARRLSRRDFLRATGMAGGGLMLAIGLPADGGPGGRTARAQEAAAKVPYPPAAFVRIGSDDSVTVLINKLEMGQGVFTSMAMLAAEELDCDWSKVRALHAPAAQVYAHPSFGIQMTGGSDSIASSWQQYRAIGATARLMLIQAAAKQWGISTEKIDTRAGVVIEIGGQKRRTGYGSLAEAAMQLPVPARAGIKADPKDWGIIGKPTPRLDSREKVNGSAEFGIDKKLPGLRVAVVARPPVFGGRAAKLDPEKAKAVKGVIAFVPVQVDRGGIGVAVVAEGYWPARQARNLLDIEWALPLGVDSAEQLAQYRQLARQPGLPAQREGDAGAVAAAARRIDAEFTFPYLAHAAMEPLNCTVDLQADRMTVWCGSQFQTVDQVLAATAAGMKPEQVELVTTFAGGGFGRRANPKSDYVVEAVRIAVEMRKAGVAGPVKVIWSREDDMKGGYYRPLHVHRVSVGLDDKGMPTGWQHVIVGQSIVKGSAFEKFMVKDGVDSTITEGVVDTAYRLPNMQVSVHHPEANVPVLWWRSVGHTHTAFVMETLIDEMAAAARQDPIAYRLALLDSKHARHRAVLALVRERSGWDKPPPKGHGRGVAVHESFGSVCAHVVEVSVQDKRIRVHRVTSAIDCGTAVNPLGIEAQVQSAMVFGLSAALYGRITLANGRVEQGNFDDYPVLRFDEMPQMSVHIVPSTAAPTGVGEPGTPPIAPAVANAIAAATGKRLRSLPFDLSA